MTDINRIIRTVRRVERAIPETESLYVRVSDVEYRDDALVFDTYATTLMANARRTVTCPLSMSPARMVRSIMRAYQPEDERWTA